MNPAPPVTSTRWLSNISTPDQSSHAVFADDDRVDDAI
jgi:hypothetical protein